MRARLFWSGTILIAVLLVGTVGYRLIGGPRYSLLDALYMTVITVATIGYGEIIDLAGNPGGRIFTMFLAVVGIGVLSYVMMNLTALVVEGEMAESFRRRRMERKAAHLRYHYVICGIGAVGYHIAHELRLTKRPYVIIDLHKETLERALEAFPDGVVIEGDATDGSTLAKAGVEHARGLFAVTADDNDNLVISLTAKQLNPGIKVVARCNEMKNSEKLMKAGADAAVSPGFIGGMRMASEMVRPTVVSFLDTMLRDSTKNLRLEEVSMPAEFAGRTLSALNLERRHRFLLLAVKAKEDWVYNPPSDYVIRPNDTLVFMTSPEERQDLENVFKTT